MCFFSFRFRKLQLVPLVLCCSVTNHNQLLYIDLTLLVFFFCFFFQNCLMSSSYHIISQSLKSYYLMKLRSGQSQKRHKSRKNVGWFIQFEWRNLCWVVIFPPLCKSLTVRIFYSLRLVPIIESLALLREVGAGTTCCLLTRQHVSASTYRSCDNTLCYIQSSAMRGMYRSRYINCSLLKKHFLSKRPKQLNSETIRPWWQTGFTHLSSVCPTCPIETFMLQSKLTRGQ